MRPKLSETMLEIAQVLAKRTTCGKMGVGCVLTDKHGRIVGTGYNGVPRHCVHCTDVPCEGLTSPSGSDLCEAVHAEQNALMRCRDVDTIYRCYTTHAPCMRCTKMLVNTGCTELIYLDDSIQEPAAKRLWQAAGRDLFKIGPF